MENSILTLYLVTICVGMFCIGVFFKIQNENKNEMLKLFIFCYSSFTLFIISSLIRTYISKTANTENDILTKYIISFQFLCLIVCVYLLAYLTNKVFIVPFANIINRSLFGVSAAIWMIGILVDCFDVNMAGLTFLIDIHEVYDTILFLYILGVYLRYKSNIKNSKTFTILKRTILITMLFVPAIFLEGIYYDDGKNVILTPAFYILISIFTLYSFMKFDDSIQNEKYSISEIFQNKYSVSPREMEVMEMLLKGYKYNKIADELQIALSTVRTHVKNIYRKTEVNSRYELYHLLKELT